MRLRRRRDAAPAAHEPAYTMRGAADAADLRIADLAAPHTLTGLERLLSVVDAVRHCVRREIPGGFAECGVWHGGSVLAMILTLQDLGVDDRDLWLYDTFEGMSEPTEADSSRFGASAPELFKAAEEAGRVPFPEYFETFDEKMVRELLEGTGYPTERLHFVRGRVEDTLPERAPDGIALLRLDTDWYESTRHELEHLYPRLAPGGVLIVDDYGHWEGCRRAVDEYFERVPRPLMGRVDYTAIMGVKA